MKPKERYSKTKSGLLVENKTYLDYLKASEYKDSYKQFCADYYLYYRNTQEPFSDSKRGQPFKDMNRFK